MPSSSQNRTKEKESDGSKTSSVHTPSNQRVKDLIEQLKLRKTELEEANRELRRVSQYRSLFLARMSHELRTPLTSILGFSEILLEQEQLTQSQRRFCQKIQDSGLRLQTSLNQLVDLSRLEEGHSELFLQEFSLREMLRESCSSLERFARMHQVNLEYELAPGVSAIVSDQGKLRQVLYNFLAWAISRSKPGEQVSIYAKVANDSSLTVCIADSGEPLADLAQVFDPEETAGARESDVNKLGIIIGRRLLEVMNGKVTLQNREDGSQVIILLPLPPPRG